MTDSKTLSNLGRWAAFLGFSVLLATLFNLPPEKIPPMVAGVNDKLFHFLDFFLLTLLGFRAFAYSGQTLFHAKAGPKATGFSLGYGTLLEWNQRFIPGRAASLWDVAANVLGSLAAFLFIFLSKKPQNH